MKSEEQIREMLQGTIEARDKARNSILEEGNIPPLGELAQTVTILNKYDTEIAMLDWVLQGQPEFEPVDHVMARNSDTSTPHRRYIQTGPDKRDIELER